MSLTAARHMYTSKDESIGCRNKSLQKGAVTGLETEHSWAAAAASTSAAVDNAAGIGRK